MFLSFPFDSVIHLDMVAASHVLCGVDPFVFPHCHVCLFVIVSDFSDVAEVTVLASLNC